MAASFAVRQSKKDSSAILKLFEIPFVLVHFDHVASLILNGNHKIRLFTLLAPALRVLKSRD